jgi:hypothetical protein
MVHKNTGRRKPEDLPVVVFGWRFGAKTQHSTITEL